jgi:hypothetical protein
MHRFNRLGQVPFVSRSARTSGALRLEFGSFVGNAGGDDASLVGRKTITEAIKMLSETSGESEDSVYASTFLSMSCECRGG